MLNKDSPVSNLRQFIDRVYWVKISLLTLFKLLYIVCASVCACVRACVRACVYKDDVIKDRCPTPLQPRDAIYEVFSIL